MNFDGTYTELIASATATKSCGVIDPEKEVPYRMRFSRGVAKAIYVLLRRANIQVSYDVIRTECEIHFGSYSDGLDGAGVKELLAAVGEKFHVVFTHSVTFDDIKKEILSKPVCHSTFVAELTLSDDSVKKFGTSYLANETINAEVLQGSGQQHQYVTIHGLEKGSHNLEVNTSWSASNNGCAVAVFNQELASSLKYLTITLAPSAKPHFPNRQLPDDFFTGITKLSVKDDELVFDQTGKTAPLGVGSYGTVYSGSMKHHEQVAVKVVDTHKVDTEILLHELAFPCSVPNVVHCYGYTMEMNQATKRMEIAIVMEVLGGTLSQVLAKVAGTPFRPEMHLELAKDILNGCAQLADADLVHRDLKPGNFLFGMTGLKIADLGSAAAAAVHRKSAGLATPDYLPPEALGKGGINTSKATVAWDTFSAGVILRRLVTGESLEDLNKLRADFPHSALPEAVGSGFKPQGDHAELAQLVLSIADRCTAENPSKRISAKDALAELHKASRK